MLSCPHFQADLSSVGPLESLSLSLSLRSQKFPQFVNDGASKATSTLRPRDAINQVPPQSRSKVARFQQILQLEPRLTARDAVFS